jgi:hypothetical protein
MISHQQARAILATVFPNADQAYLYQPLQAIAWALSSYGFRFKDNPGLTDNNWLAYVYPGVACGTQPGYTMLTPSGPKGCVPSFPSPEQGINTVMQLYFPLNPDGSAPFETQRFIDAAWSGNTDALAQIMIERGWGWTNREMSFAEAGAGSLLAAQAYLSQALYAAANEIRQALSEPMRLSLPGLSGLPTLPGMPSWPQGLPNPWPDQPKEIPPQQPPPGGGTTPPPETPPAATASKPWSTGQKLLAGAAALGLLGVGARYAKVILPHRAPLSAASPLAPAPVTKDSSWLIRSPSSLTRPLARPVSRPPWPSTASSAPRPPPPATRPAEPRCSST